MWGCCGININLYIKDTLHAQPGSYLQPWVRLHAIRDYYSMAALVWCSRCMSTIRGHAPDASANMARPSSTFAL